MYRNRCLFAYQPVFYTNASIMPCDFGSGIYLDRFEAILAKYAQKSEDVTINRW